MYLSMVIYENLTLTCQPKVDFILFIGVCVQEPCFCSLSVRVPIFKLFVYGECDNFFFWGGGEGAFILGKLEPQQCHVTQYLLFLKVRAENFHGYSESST